MSEALKIFIDRLKGGHTQKIEEAIAPAFLGPDEPELRFAERVQVQGEAYLTDSHLIVHLKARTRVLMPCAVCNQMIGVELKVDNFYHTQPVEEVPRAVFDCSEQIREALLIELPRTVECAGGKCPERTAITPYLRSEARVDKTIHFPFADMDDLK